MFIRVVKKNRKLLLISRFTYLVDELRLEKQAREYLATELVEMYTNISRECISSN